jgi:ribosome-binding ATPase YchF (GTP1/OBG family)
MRILVTKLSAKDIERIYHDCQKLKADMKQEETTIDRLIEEELSTLYYLETHIAGTSTHAHLKKEAERRIEYLKKLKETA